ncbi:MAG: hypothetical protein GX921_01370, partial [Bacteroidales bacterium]|nr:hypothetical protein [Bacteroidales bacterium]
VAPNFSAGNYTLTMESSSICDQSHKVTKRIDNQRDFIYGFKRIGEDFDPGDDPNYGDGGNGSSPGQGVDDEGNPIYPTPTPAEDYTIFEVWVQDAQPNTYVQLLLETSAGQTSVFGGNRITDDNGNLRILVKMKDSDLEIANANGNGDFKFLNKEGISYKEYHNKKFPFNVPLEED